MPEIRKTPAAQSKRALISVKVIPRSSRVSIQQEGANHYRVKLTAPPVEGEANEQLVRVLSKQLSIPRRQITIVSGPASRNKQVQVEGLSESEIEAILKEAR